MKRLVLPALLLFSAMFAGVAFERHCPGCIDGSRVNKTCQWTDDLPLPVGIGDPADSWHLVADAQLAEELAIRYADAEFNRLYGYEAHGGIEGSARNDCMARLVDQIEHDHGVSSAEIATARGRRDPRFDALAALSFAPVYWVAAAAASGALYRRFSKDRRLIRVAAVGLASVVATVLGLQAGQLWLGVWETIRVRNGHISVFRAATRTVWTHDHAGAVLVAGTIVFWLAAICHRQAGVRFVTARAAIFFATMVAAMFADVFVQNVIGYVLLAATLLIFYGVVSRDESTSGSPSWQRERDERIIDLLF